jgi:uncharacterized membrane protein
MSAYSLMSLGLLAWLVFAAINAPYIGLWNTTSWNVGLAIIAMLVACILFARAVNRANSLSISFKGGETDMANPGILAITRHPIILAFLIWSAAHLLVNGDVVGVILFGGILLFSIIGMRVAEKRASKNRTDDEIEMYKSLTSGSILARIKRAASLKFLVEIACGFALFLVLLFGHQYVIGVDPLAYF